MEREPINWELLARQLGSLTTNGEVGDSGVALKAIELLIGEDRLRSTVDYYLEGRPGSELGRFVLWRIHPWSAMRRCYEIYHSDADDESRVSAIELLRVVADNRALSWVEEFLADPNPGIQFWGAGVLDQLLWSSLISPEAGEAYLRKVEEHPSEQVREQGVFIRDYLRSRL